MYSNITDVNCWWSLVTRSKHSSNILPSCSTTDSDYKTVTAWNVSILFFRYSVLSKLIFLNRRCSICHHKKSLREGSFFAEFPRIPLRKILMLIYLWSVRELRTTASDMVVLTKATVGSVYALLRHWCKRDLQDRPVIPFGGNVYVVKCDESQFKHKSKVSCSSTSNISSRIQIKWKTNWRRRQIK